MKLSLRIVRSLAPLLAAAAWIAACEGPGGAGPSDPSAEEIAGTTSSGDVASDAPSGSPTTVVAARPSPTPTTEASARATQVASETLPRYVRAFGRQGHADGEFQLPYCLAVDAEGLIYVGDTTGLQVVDAQGSFIKRIGAGELTAVTGVAVSPDGNRVYAAHQVGEVAIFNGEGARIGTLGSPGTEPGNLNTPVSLAIDAGGRVYVGDSSTHRVEVFGADGAHIRTIGEPGTGSGQFTSPRALAIDDAGGLYVGLGDDFLIQRFTPDGVYSDSLGHGYSDENMFRIGGLALDAGKLFASRSVNQYIQVFDVGSEDAVWEGDFGAPGQEAGAFNTPTGIVVHAGELFVADQNNHRVQVFSMP